MAPSDRDAQAGLAPVTAHLPVIEGPTQPPYNRKNKRPSEAMWDSDGSHYRCPWIEDSITVHSDGNITCGLDDPHGQRSFGNARESSVETIFANPEYRKLQEKLWNGHRCHGCALYRPADENDPPPAVRPRMPKSLVVETTVKCNLRCPNTACIPNNEKGLLTRDAASLDLETLKVVTDQVAPHLETIHFYNYGEPFLNRQAEDMLLHLRGKCPGALITTSTNAILLADPARAEKVIRAGLDKIIVSISGVTQDVYGIYHAGGKCEKALAGLKNLCDIKRRLDMTKPRIIIRYLVFHWNDRDEHIDAVIAMAKEYGVDQLLLHLTDEPIGARSARFSPGSPSYVKYNKYIRVDHAGRLDQLYHCELPDDDGLFRLYDMADFGLVRRTTGSTATLRRGGRNGRIRLSLATDRPLSRSEDQTCLIQTPWRTVKVWLTYGIWKDVSIRVPRRYRGAGPLEIRVATDDYWFPADEWGNDDLRCLGVLVRPTALVQPGSSRRRRLDLRLRATVRRFWRRVSRVAPMRLLSAWASQLRPAGAAQRLPRADEDPAREAEAKRLEQMMTRLYRTVLGRSPDAAGLDGWMDLLVNGFCVPIQVAQFFVSSTEFRAIYGDDPTPEHFVAIACRNTLGHDPDPPDSRRWADFLAEHGNGTPARAATALGIMNAIAPPDRPTVATGAHPAIPRPHFKSRALRRSPS